jgi:anti-sigma B factor antagonist
MERRKQQRRKGPTRVGGDRRAARAYGGPERRVADRRGGLDRRKFDIIVDYQVRSIPILRCSGRITIGDTATSFSTRCSEMLQRSRPTFALDLTGVNHIDSTGVGRLASLLTSARTRGGDLKLIAPSRKVESVLRTTGLYDLFHILSTAQELAEFSMPRED